MSSNTTIRIGNDDLFFDVGPNQKTYIIAELSGNHGQSLPLAKTMVVEAAKAGAHAIKLQTYTADSMTLDVYSPDFVIKERDRLWAVEKLFNLYAKDPTPYECPKNLSLLIVI